jgi:hypothetical protein
MKRNYSLADALSIALARLTQAADPIIDVESRSVPVPVPVPVNAIFNLKTEDMVTVFDDDGKPMYQQTPGANSPKKVVKQAKTLEKPILASKVFFDDGSWTVVKNSGDDTVDITEKELSNGKTVKVATNASKEHAVAYAFVKRILGHVDPVTKEVKGANLGRRFEKIIAASIDQNVENAEIKIKKAKAKPAQQTQHAQQAKPACRCRQINEKSLKETLDLLVGELAKKLNLDKVVDEDQQGA